MKKLLTVLGVVLLLVVAVVIFVLFLRPNDIISKAEAKARYSYPELKFRYWHGAEIHYTDTGAGPPIMMIHGFGGSFTNFEPLAHLLQKNHRVICLDLPGFGLSDLPDDHAQGFVPMYRSFTSFMIDHLHLDSVYIIGNSMGGWMAWETANVRPEKVKKLVLLGSAGYDLEQVRKNLGMSDALKSPLVGLLIKRGMPMSISVKIARKIRADSSPLDMDEVSVSNALTNRKGNLQNIVSLAISDEMPDSSRIAKVACPTLIIWGKQDRIVPVEHAYRFKRDIPNSSLIVYDSCGHVSMLEYPERMAKDVEAFFSAKP